MVAETVLMTVKSAQTAGPAQNASMDFRSTRKISAILTAKLLALCTKKKAHQLASAPLNTTTLIASLGPVNSAGTSLMTVLFVMKISVFIMPMNLQIAIKKYHGEMDAVSQTVITYILVEYCYS